MACDNYHPDGYGHGECRHCGVVEELHGDVLRKAEQRGAREERERIALLIESRFIGMDAEVDRVLDELIESLRGEHEEAQHGE